MSSLAAGLKAIGMKRGDRVMLVAENRPEWCISDLAIMAAGCVTVPTYTTNTERDHAHIIENSGACAIIVSTEKLARTLMPAVLRSNQGQTVIGIDPMRAPSTSIDFHDWHRLIADHPADPARVAAEADFQRNDLACIIYTSGTGGAARRDAAPWRVAAQCERLRGVDLRGFRLGRRGVPVVPAALARL